MAIGDYTYLLKPQSGDTTPHNELNGSQTISGGTISLIDRGGGVYAWRFSGSNSSGSTPSKSIVAFGSSTGGGIIIAVQMRAQAVSTTRHRMLAWSTSTNPADNSTAFRFELSGDDITVYGRGSTGYTFPFGTYDGTLRTYVARVRTNYTSSSEITEYWQSGLGAGPGPDHNSGSWTGGDTTLNTIVIECGDGTVDIVRVALWAEELSDADCDAIRDDFDTALGLGGDTTAPVLTSVTGTGGAGTSSGSFSSNEAGTAYWKLTATSTPESVPAYPAAMTGWSSLSMSSGSNSIPVLTATPGTYWLQVVGQDAANNRGAAPTVSAASFTVSAPPENPVITDQPDNSTVKAGQTATFTVAATGSGTVTYQWQVNTGSGWGNVSNGGPYSGATTATLSVVTARSMTGYQYRCNVSDDDAGPVASSAATLTVQQCVLALDHEAYAFGDGNSAATMARENNVAWELAVVPDELPVTSTLYHVASVNTGSNGRFADIGDDDFLFGVTYLLMARRVGDGEWIAFPIAAS